jgi:hypothetical protein
VVLSRAKERVQKALIKIPINIVLRREERG